MISDFTDLMEHFLQKKWHNDFCGSTDVPLQIGRTNIFVTVWLYLLYFQLWNKAKEPRWLLLIILIYNFFLNQYTQKKNTLHKRSTEASLFDTHSPRRSGSKRSHSWQRRQSSSVSTRSQHPLEHHQFTVSATFRQQLLHTVVQLPLSKFQELALRKLWLKWIWMPKQLKRIILNVGIRCLAVMLWVICSSDSIAQLFLPSDNLLLLSENPKTHF